MKITIRPCEPTDFEAVYDMIVILEGTPFSKENQAAIFIENLNNPNHFF